jgi:hypothetical protein
MVCNQSLRPLLSERAGVEFYMRAEAFILTLFPGRVEKEIL